MFAVYYHKNFKKRLKRVPKKIQDKFEEKLKIFISNSFSAELNNHKLSSEWVGHRSIDITGDLRAVYKMEGDTAIFLEIDNHSNLYG
jgi:addiction module RelE/StbE family toxin